MRNHRRFIAAVACLAPFLISTAAHATTVSGRVTDSITGRPVADLNVGIGPVGSGLRDYTRTDVDGKYAFEVSEGKVNVCFLPDPGVNLLKRCWRDENAPIYGQNIPVPAEGTVEGIDTGLAPGTSVTGTVVDWERKPLAGVCVVAWGPQSGGIGRFADVASAEDGSYTLTGLRPGVPTKILFSTSGWGFGGCAGGVTDPLLVDQWFDRQSSYDTGTAVVARASETVAGVDGYLGGEAIPPAGVVPARRSCVVPRLRNRTFTRARDALSAAGCSTLKPALRISRSYARGRVIKASVAAKRRLRRGRAVRLTVSRGPG